jgi:hypothetical protein
MQRHEARFQLFLEVSADIQNRMAEIWALREAVRTAEAALRSPEPIHPAVVAPPPGNELRLTNRTALANAIRLVEEVVAVAQRLLGVLVDRHDDRLDVWIAVALARGSLTALQQAP